jgi:predicted secreted protein
MIAEIFPDSFIFPVMGVTDGYPTYYSKFDFTDEETNEYVADAKLL